MRDEDDDESPKPEKSRQTVTGAESAKEVSPPRRGTQTAARTSSLRTSSSQTWEFTPPVSSQPTSFSSYSSFTGEYELPSSSPHPPETGLQLPSLPDLVPVQSTTSPQRRFDIRDLPPSETSPRVHRSQPPPPPSRTRDERIQGPPLPPSYASPARSFRSERDLPRGPAQSSPLRSTRSHPHQRSHSRQVSRQTPYPKQPPPRDTRTLPTTFEPQFQPPPNIPPSHRVSRQAHPPRPASPYHSSPIPHEPPRHQHPPPLDRERNPSSVPPPPPFYQSPYDPSVFIHPQPHSQSHHHQHPPPTPGRPSASRSFPASSFGHPPRPPLATPDIELHRASERPPIINPYSMAPPPTHPPPGFPAVPYQPYRHPYFQHHPYEELYPGPAPSTPAPPPPPPPPSSPVYHTRSRSHQQFDPQFDPLFDPHYNPPQGSAPTSQSTSKRRRPPEPYSSYANMLGDMINQHRRRKMTLQEIYTLLRERYGDHFPDEDDDTKVVSGSGGGWRNTVRHALSVNRWFKKQSRTDADAKLDETEPDRDEPRPIDDDTENVAPPTSRKHGVQGGDRPLKGGYWFIRERYRQEVEEAVARDNSRLVKYQSSAEEEQEEEMHSEEQILGGYSGHEGYGLPGDMSSPSSLLPPAIPPQPSPPVLPPLPAGLPLPPLPALAGLGPPSLSSYSYPPPAVPSSIGRLPGDHLQPPPPGARPQTEREQGTRDDDDDSYPEHPSSFPRRTPRGGRHPRRHDHDRPPYRKPSPRR